MGKDRPGYPDYIKTVRRGSKVYEYFDTGRNAAGKRVYVRMPAKTDRGYGGTYASLLAARVKRETAPVSKTINELSREYQHDTRFKKRSEATKRTYSFYIAIIEKNLGPAPLDEIERKDVQALMDAMQDRPGAANMTLTVLRQMYRHALARDYVKYDPCKHVETFARDDDEGHVPWPEPLLTAALADPELGLPVALLYYTAQRIGDVCKMRWNDIRDGYLFVEQEKTGKQLDIRIHSKLAAVLRRTPHTAMTIIHGPTLRPLKVSTLRQRIQKFAADRGYGTADGYKIVPHGLRKNAINTLLEVGCTVSEASAISGQTLKMVEHYARRRDTRKMGSAAILKWEEQNEAIENDGNSCAKR